MKSRERDPSTRAALRLRERSTEASSCGSGGGRWHREGWGVPRPAGHVPRPWAAESRGQLPGGIGQPSNSPSDTLIPPRGDETALLTASLGPGWEQTR